MLSISEGVKALWSYQNVKYLPVFFSKCTFAPIALIKIAMTTDLKHRRELGRYWRRGCERSRRNEWPFFVFFFFSFFSTGTYVYFALSRNTSYSWKMRLQRPQASPPRSFPLHSRPSTLRAHSQSPFRLPSHRNAFHLESHPTSNPPTSNIANRHPPIPHFFPHHRLNVEQDNNYTCTYNYICALS